MRRTLKLGIVLLTLICSWFFTIPAQALEGRVFGPDGEPLANARIVVVGRAGSILSDNDGYFSLDPAPDPPFKIVVARADGVALPPVTIERLSEENLLEVRLAPVLAESVTVISGIVPDAELPPAAGATVIGSGDLEQRKPASLAEAMEDIPGIGRSGNGHAAVPSLRGLPKSRTLLLLDEGRVTSERRAGPSATFLEPETVEEIEVIRGPGSVAYGSDAFGGVVRIRSRIPEPGAPASFRYSLGGAVGAGEAGGTAEYSAPVLGGGLLAGVQYRRFNDYESPEGTIYNSGAEKQGLRLAYQTHTLGGSLRFGWRTDVGKNIGKPAVDSLETRVYYPEERSHRFGVSFERPGPGPWSQISISAAWDDYRLVLNKDRFATEDDPRRVTGSDVDAQDFEFRATAERPLGKTRLIIGFNSYGRFGLRSVNRMTEYDTFGEPMETAEEVSIENAHREDVGLFAGLSGRAGIVALAAGLRLDRVRSKNNGGFFGDDTKSHSDFSGFFSAGVPVRHDLELTAQVARGFRDALLSDRYYRGFTGRGFITGNPDLEPETSLQYDLAARFWRRRYQVALFTYLYRIRDLIERYSVEGDYYFRNRGEAEIRGIELETSVELRPWMELQFGAQVLRGEAIDDGSSTDDIPADGFSVTFRGRPAEEWWWMARTMVNGRDDRPGPTERIVPGHVLFDAGFGWRFSRHLELQLMGRNLLDKTYPGSSDEDAVPAPGRSLQFGIRGEF